MRQFSYEQTIELLRQLEVLPARGNEERNQPLQQFLSRMAEQRMDFRRYFPFGDLWVPNNLGQGDIVRCDLKTDFYRTGNYEVCTRNCLVLGVTVNSKTLDLESIRLVRFSYHTLFHSEGHELLIDPLERDWRTKISGLMKPAILRTGKIEDVPPFSEFFGHYIDRGGRISAEKFPILKFHLHKGAALNGFKLRNYAENRMGSKTERLFLPGLDPSLFPKASPLGIKQLPPEIDYFSLMPEEREDIIERLQASRIAKIISGRLQHQNDKGFVQASRQAEAEALAVAKAYVRELRRTIPSHRSDDIYPVLNETVARLVECSDEEAGRNKWRRVQDISPMQDILAEQRLAAAQVINTRAEGLKRIAAQTIDSNSLRDLETLGIGGLLREPTIQLPKQLWQGRFLFMRIPNLLDPAMMSDVAFRPCAIWRAFAKVNEEGEPVLAGFELHPCTRSAANAFGHTMGVRPLDGSKKTSHLIADLIIRAPLNAEYFQPEQQADAFYDLLPNQIRDMETKRSLVQANGGFKVYGLQDIPAEWVEIKLPDPPDERVRQKIWHPKPLMPRRQVSHQKRQPRVNTPA
jgi:hypothetical protein